MNIGTKELVKNMVTRTVKSAITKTFHTEDTTLILIHTLPNTALPHAIIPHPEEDTPPTSPGSQKGLDLAHPCRTVPQMSKNTLTGGGNDVILSL